MHYDKLCKTGEYNANMKAVLLISKQKVYINIKFREYKCLALCFVCCWWSIPGSRTLPLSYIHNPVFKYHTFIFSFVHCQMFSHHITWSFNHCEKASTGNFYFLIKRRKTKSDLGHLVSLTYVGSLSICPSTVVVTSGVVVSTIYCTIRKKKIISRSRKAHSRI